MSRQSALEHQLEGGQAMLSQVLAELAELADLREELADLKEVQATMFSIVRMVRPYMRQDETIQAAIRRIIAEWQADAKGAKDDPPVWKRVFPTK